MSMHARTFIGTLVIVAASLPPVARAQDAARTDGWVVLALDDYRALRSRAFPATPDPLPPPVDATLTQGRLRAARQRRYRLRRRALDDRRAEAGMGQHPDAGGPTGPRRAARRAPDRPRRRQPATCAGLATRPLGARAGDRRSDRSREWHRVDDAARLRVGALRGDADRAAHRHGPLGQRRLRGGADRGQRRKPLDGVRIAGTAAQILLEAQDRRSAIDAAAPCKGANHRARRARRGCVADHRERQRRSRAGSGARRRSGDTGGRVA